MTPRDKKHQGPEALGEILGRLFAARGWGRRQGQLKMETTWADVIGPTEAAHTRIAAYRRGVLEIFVDNAVLWQELVHFRKRRLLEEMRGRLPDTPLRDLRFRMI